MQITVPLDSIANLTRPGLLPIAGDECRVLSGEYTNALGVATGTTTYGVVLELPPRYAEA